MTMNGYDLASQVLAGSRFSCDQLLRLARNQESDWLEFKAALYPLPDVQSDQGGPSSKSNENESDYFWNVAKAVIAMANSGGGVVLLGVSDDGEPVDLALSDPKNHLSRSCDEFIRLTLEKAIFPKNRKWSTAKSGVWSLNRLPVQLTEIHAATLKSRPVIAIIVRALPASDKTLFKCTEIVNGEQYRSLVLCRQSGQVGRVRELIDHEEIHEFIQTRETPSPVYDALWQEFLAGSPLVEQDLDELLRREADLKHRLEAELLRNQADAKAVKKSSGASSDDVRKREHQGKNDQSSRADHSGEVVIDLALVRKFKIFADTGALMHESASIFFEDQLVPLLRTANENLLISERTVDFLQHAASKGTRYLAHKAAGGLAILERLQNAQCVVDCKDPYPIPGERFATDVLFKELFVKYQLETPLCMITQCTNLARYIIANSRSAAFQQARPVHVFYLDNDGMPRAWNTDASNGDGDQRVANNLRVSIEEEVARNHRILVDTSSLMLSNKEKSVFIGRDFFSTYCVRSCNASTTRFWFQFRSRKRYTDN